MTEPPATDTIARPTAGLTAILVTASVLLIVGAPIAMLGSINTEALERSPLVSVTLLLLPLLLLTPLPLTFGLIVATGNADPRTADGRMTFRRLVLIAAVLVVTLSSTLIASAVTGVLSPLAAALIALTTAGFTAASFWLGEIIRQRDAARPRLPWPPPESRLAKIPQRARWIYWSFLIAFAVTAGVLAAIVAATGDTTLLEPSALLTALSIPLVVTGLAGSIVLLTLTSEAGSLVGSDVERQKRLSRALRTLSTAELPSDERVAAQRYAGAMAALIPPQVAVFVFILGGFTAMRLSSLLSPSDDLKALDIGILAFVAVATGVLVPFTLRRGRRLRRFATATDETPSPPRQ